MFKTVAVAGVSALAMIAGSAAAQDWQGFYAGGFAGYQKLSQQDDETVLFDTNLDGRFGDTVNTTAPANAFSPGFCDGSPKGNNAGAGCNDDEDGSGEFGVRAGYDFQTGPIVVGVVADFSVPTVQDSVTAFSTTPANYSFQREVQHLVGARFRLGLAYGRYLPYVTGGYASAEVRDQFSSSNTGNGFTPTVQNQDAEGYQLGAGIETKVTSNFSVGLEYLYTDIDTDPLIVRTSQGTQAATNPFILVNANGTDQRRSNDKLELHAFRITGAWHF